MSRIFLALLIVLSLAATAAAQNYGAPIPNGAQAVTQSPGDNTNAVATDAFAQAAANAAAQKLFVPTSAGGTANAIVLTPISGTVSAYSNYQHFGFVAAGTSSNPVTIAVGSLSTLNAYRPDGSTRLLERDIESGDYYDATYNSALNSGSGGFIVTSTSKSFSQGMSNDAAVRIASPGTAKTYLLVYNGGNGLWLWNATTARWEWCFVNGAFQTIDTTNTYVNGVPGQALAVSSSYYVYAWTNGNGAILVNHALASTVPVTGGSNNDVTGYFFLPSSQAYREIGAVGTDASGNIWAAGTNGVTYNGIGSYYQRQRITLVMSPQPTGSRTNTAWGEISSAQRLNAWWWGDGSEGTAGLSGSIQCSSVGAEVDLGISIDGVNPPLDFQRITCTATSTYFPVNVSVSSANLTEGMHSLQIWAKASAGSISLQPPMTFFWNILE